MKSCLEIIADYRRTLAAAESLENEIANALPSAKRSELFGIEKKTDELLLLRIECKILHDNARRACINEDLPFALEIWNKYAGKKLGPKTKEKIRNEQAEKAGAYLYFSPHAFLSGNHEVYFGSKNDFFRYKDFEFSCEFENGEEAFPPLSPDNKIQVVPAESLYLHNCGEYCDDTRARAREIVKAWEAVKEANKALENAMSKYNSLIPGKMERVHRGDYCGRLNV